jgi:hypothetical protein
MRRFDVRWGDIASEKRSKSKVKFLKKPIVEPLWNTACHRWLLERAKIIFPGRSGLRRVLAALQRATRTSGVGWRDKFSQAD